MTNKNLAALLETKSTYLREDIIKILLHAGSGHCGGSMSAIDIMNALYNGGILCHDPKNPLWIDRDRFIAPGHKSPALAVTLADTGYVQREEMLSSFRDFKSRFQGHTSSKDLPGVDVSTGSLGQIISIAAGMAYGLRFDKRKSKVYVLVGDGELQEGQNWEAIMSAAKYCLSNLCLLIDNNSMQIDGTTSEVMPLEPITQKLEAFGWRARRIKLHESGKENINYEGLLEELNAFKEYTGNQPTVIVTDTIKAFGVPDLQAKVSSHGVAPNKEQAEEAIKYLQERRANLREINGESFDKHVWVPLSGLTDKHVNRSREYLSIDLNAPEFSDFKPNEKIATRKAYGAVLRYMARTKKADIFVLDADLAKSTTGAEVDKEESFDSRRHIDLGVAEANMVNWAAGLSTTETESGEKRIVFASSFAVFVPGRCYEQIRNTIAYSSLDVNLIGTHAGLVTGKDGGSHQAIEDIALARSIPNMRVYSPADAVSAVKAIEAAINYEGPAYLRLSRESTPCIYTKKSVSDAYKAKPLISSKQDKASIVSTGHLLKQALDAQKQLSEENIRVGVYDFTSIKPLDTEALKEISKIGPIVTVEDHSTTGGFGEAVAAFVSEECSPVRILRVGVRDKFGQSGNAEELMKEYKMTSKDIAERVKSILK